MKSDIFSKSTLLVADASVAANLPNIVRGNNMHQPERQGQIRLIILVTMLLACLTNLTAIVSDYKKTLEFSVPQGTTIIHARTLLAVAAEAPVALFTRHDTIFRSAASPDRSR